MRMRYHYGIVSPGVECLFISTLREKMRDVKYIRCALLNSGSTVATNRFVNLSTNAAKNVRYRKFIDFHDSCGEETCFDF